MQNQNSIFELLFRIFLKNSFTPKKTGEKDNHAENLAILAALGMLACVGFDAMKVVFRRDFGAKGFNMFRVILAFLAFLIISGVGIYLSISETDFNPKIGTHLTFGIAGAFYLVVAIYVLVAGIQKKRISRSNSQINPGYEGDSHLLGFLIHEKGWKQSNVQFIAEPILVLLLGILLALVNVLWGIPLIVCALSVWGAIIVNFIFGVDPVGDKLIKQGYQRANNDFTYTNN